MFVMLQLCLLLVVVVHNILSRSSVAPAYRFVPSRSWPSHGHESESSENPHKEVPGHEGHQGTGLCPGQATARCSSSGFR